MSKSIFFERGAFTGYCIKCKGLRIFLNNKCCKCGTSYPEREDMSFSDYFSKYYRGSKNDK